MARSRSLTPLMRKALLRALVAERKGRGLMFDTPSRLGYRDERVDAPVARGLERRGLAEIHAASRVYDMTLTPAGREEAERIRQEVLAAAREHEAEVAAARHLPRASLSVVRDSEVRS